MQTYWEKLNSSMPFRVAVLFTLFYLLCLSIGSYFFYTSMQTRLTYQQDNILTQRYSRLADVFNESGIEAVIRLAERTGSDDPVSFGIGYQIIGPDDNKLISNFNDFDRQHGFYSIDPVILGFNPGSPAFRFFTAPLDVHTITLGINKRLSADLRMAYITSSLLTFLLTTILALAGALFLANRSHARIKKVVDIMDDVGKGNLDARLPTSYRNDDIDKLSNEMNNTLSQLQQKIYGLKLMGFNIAHDLKTPMNRLYIKIEEAMGSLNEGDPAVPVLEAASEEASSINRMFEALLRITQIESGAVKTVFKPIELNQLLRRAFEIYEYVAEEKQQALKLNCDNSAVPVLGSEELLLQLISNLVENAITHCAPESSIIVSSGIVGDDSWLRVCDTGAGIPEKERINVLRKLYRLDSSRTTTGSGLGLSMVKAIADIHDATIDMSDNGPGLCITVRFI